MDLIPNGITAQGPGGTDTDKPISLCFAEHVANEKEKQSHCRQDRCTHFEKGPAEIPEDGQLPDISQEQHDHKDEEIKGLAKFSHIFFEGIKVRYSQEKQKHSQRNYGHHKDTPEPTHIPINHIVDTPVGCHWVGQ